MFRIGDFSRLTQVTVKALRHYDSLGLLTPAHTDPFTGYRYYSAAQLPRLNRLLALKDLGLSLEQIGPFLDAELSTEQLRTLLLVKQAETRRQLEEEEARLARIDARLRLLSDQAKPTYDVVVKHVEALRVASLRERIPERPAIPGLFQRLSAYQRRHGLAATGWLVIWHDPDFREADVDAEAAFVTADPLPPDAKVRGRELPAIETMACVVHQGAPETIGSACMALAAWIEANGYRVAGPERVRAIERGGPESIAELQVPVVAAGASTGEPGDDPADEKGEGRDA
jgi:DNA-binding transcriptional MerR regulator